MGTSGGTSGGGGFYSLPDGIDPPASSPHAIPCGPVGANLSMVLNLLYIVPLPIGANQRTLVELSVECASGAAVGGLFRMGLLASTTRRQPSTVLDDYGTLDATTTGVKVWIPNRVLAANALFYPCIALQVATGAALKAIASYNPYVTLQGGSLAGSTGFSAYVMSGVSGAITNPFSYFDVDEAPRIGVKLT